MWLSSHGNTKENWAVGDGPTLRNGDGAAIASDGESGVVQPALKHVHSQDAEAGLCGNQHVVTGGVHGEDGAFRREQ